IGGSGNDVMYAQAHVAPVAKADLVKTAGQGNHSIGTAMSVDNAFHRAFDAEIISSTTIPHATVNATSAGAHDFYSFTVTEAGQTVTFEIDYSTGFDPVLRLYSAGGVLLASNDDGPMDVGSDNWQDSFVSYTFSTPGTYYIAVDEYAWVGSGGHPDYAPPAAGSTYVLNISLTGVDTPGGAVTGSTLEGRGGADTLYGDIGDDILIGGAGNDTIHGGDGIDTAVFAGLQSAYSWSESEGVVTVVGPDGTDTLTGVEFLQFDDATVPLAAGGLNYVGTAGPDIAQGTELDDTLDGAGGDDQLRGLGGNDVLIGGTGADFLDGGAGDDELFGGADNDRMYGRAGVDILHGEGGHDLM